MLLLAIEAILTEDNNALGFYGTHFTPATCQSFYMLPNVTASACVVFKVHESPSLSPISSACRHGRSNPRFHSVRRWNTYPCGSLTEAELKNVRHIGPLQICLVWVGLILAPWLSGET